MILTAYAEKLGITKEQFTCLVDVVKSIDVKRAEFFQETDTDLKVLEGVRHNLLNVRDKKIQLAQEAVEAVQDYERDRYFAEHENDEIYELAIDIETYSSVDLTKSGVYRYAEAPDFQVLLFAYAVNNSPVRCIDLANGEQIPQRIITALTDEDVLKTAYNANFERTCLARLLGTPMPPAQWDCTMIRAARLGLPLSLSACGEVLDVAQKKMKEGNDLIRYFSKPNARTKKRNMPESAPDKWKTFIRYCIRDVEVEQQIRKRVSVYQVTDTERKAWIVDQIINDRGVLCDTDMAQSASALFDDYQARITQEAVALSDINNPKSVAQLKTYLQEKTGMEVSTLNKDTVSKIISQTDNPEVKRVLQIRQELGKTSVMKYKAMLACACEDNRIRGLLQFYGANRTGRFAGRLVQMQNLPQNHIPDIDYARQIVKKQMLNEIELEYGNTPQVLSELIRTAFIARAGCVFHVCDYSAIEARVIAWLAGEQWVLDTFNAGGDIYCATASKMFGVKVEKNGENSELRKYGKVASLACGYGGGVEAFKKMGGEKLGLSESEMHNNVTDWRNANPRIVRLWKHVEQAAKTAIDDTAYPIEKGLQFVRKWGGVSIRLPSGRELFYPRMRYNASGRLCYEGVNQTTKKWETLETYGGKLTENIVQAIARDCLVETILRIEEAGLPIVFHVHDEVVVEVPESVPLSLVEEVFNTPISWAKGLPLRGVGYTTPYYIKD